MKITEITVSKGFKFSANYNSVDGNVSITGKLDPEDKYEEEYVKISELVDAELEEEKLIQINFLKNKG